MSSAATVLRLDHVHAGYSRQRVLRDVSLSLAPGMRVGLIGPNGSGKSTLFRVALGTLPAWQGSVEVFGKPVHQLDQRQRPVAYVPQARQLDLNFPVSARDVVAMGRIGRLGLFRVARRADHTLVDAALAQVGLSHKASQPFGALSGGEQQRLLLARALAAEARLFFLDEPVTGMDAHTQVQFGGIVERLVADGSTVVISTHDLSDENLARFDWLICLNGEVIAQGPPATVTSLDTWRRLFSARAVSGLGV